MYTSKISCTIPVSRAMKRGIYFTVSISSIDTTDQEISQTAEFDMRRSTDSKTAKNHRYPNSNDLMGQFLLMLQANLSYGLLELSSYSDKKISSKITKAILIVPEKDTEKAKDFVFQFQKELTPACSTNNALFRIQFTFDDEEEIELVLDDYSQDRAITLLSLMPKEIPNLTGNTYEQTDSFFNLEYVHLENETFQIHVSILGCSNFTYNFMTAKVSQLTEMMGGYASNISSNTDT